MTEETIQKGQQLLKDQVHLANIVKELEYIIGPQSGDPPVIQDGDAFEGVGTGFNRFVAAMKSAWPYLQPLERGNMGRALLEYVRFARAQAQEDFEQL